METLFCRNREEWNEWLEKNHDCESEIWLVYLKKNTKKESIKYDEAVEEALCFGWIDSLVKSIDNVSYMQKFTPRKPRSMWSVVNKNRVQKLIEENRMKEPGLKMVKIAKQNGQWDKAYSSKIKQVAPIEFVNQLKSNKVAFQNFYNFSESNQNKYLAWINSAKRQETINKRINKVIERSERNIKPGMV